eukprot:scaffold38889_cov48-Attheya_sp.AAC.2
MRAQAIQIYASPPVFQGAEARHDSGEQRHNNIIPIVLPRRSWWEIKRDSSPGIGNDCELRV